MTIKGLAGVGYAMVAAGLAVSILTVSLGRTSLKIMASEGRCEMFKNDEIKVKRVDDLGGMVEQSYDLPQVGILPNNPLYGFKRIRDKMWLVFSFNPIDKSRIAYFMADKKIAEANRLVGDGQIDLAMESANEAIDSLVLAYETLEKIKGQGQEVTQMKIKMAEAAGVYEEIIGTFCSSFGTGTEKYSYLVNKMEKLDEITAEN